MQDKITEQAAYNLGTKGAKPTELERMLFEAWMRGHCWKVCGTWDGTTYIGSAEQGEYLDPHAIRTRQLWAAWRDRGALAAPQCLLQIQEPATKPQALAHYSQQASLAMGEAGAAAPAQAAVDALMAAPKLGDTWKARMLDGQPLVRDKDGIGYHPALPDFDESVKCAEFFASLGIELKCGMAENEMDSEAYEAMTENGLSNDGDNYNAWTPKRPEGDGWSLVAVFDTEDGPACWWMRDKPFEPQRSEGYRARIDNAAVEVLAMNMKAKLEGQRSKGYRGWDNDCTQQHLSDLLRQCVEKGDPVDVANFCAFLLARGETIAPQASPAAVAVPAGWVQLSEQDKADMLQKIRDWSPALHPENGYMITPEGAIFAFEKFLAEKARAALAATPAADAPVELPEPDAAIKEVMLLVNEVQKNRVCAELSPSNKGHFNSRATEASKAIVSKLRALLAGGSAPAAPHASQRDELLQVALDFIGTLTGMSPPPIEVAPPEVFAPFYAFVDRVQAITAPQVQADARDAGTFEQRISDWQQGDALDAARYRWLRDLSVPPHNFYLSVPDEFKDERYKPPEVDAAIDAAIAAQAASNSKL